MATDIDPNIVIETSGITATIATDAVVFSGSTAHFQLMKLAYGLTGAATLVSSTNPLPVNVTSALTANIAGFTGTFTVEGKVSGTPVPVSGTVYVAGTTATPVYVANYSGTRIEVTGGRPLGKSTDSVSVFGPSGNTWVYVNLVNSSGTQLGNSANPLYTIISGATVSVTLSTTVGVTNDGTSALKIQGISGGTSVATTVGNTVGINDTNILNGITNVYNRMGTMGATLDAIYNALAVFGLVRPTTAKAGTMSITTASVGFSGFTCSAGINFKSLGTNTDLIYIGTSTIGTSFGYQLEPGENAFFDVGNLNLIYVQAKTGTQTLSYFAS
jgi:hypothetical protein